MSTVQQFGPLMVAGLAMATSHTKLMSFPLFIIIQSGQGEQNAYIGLLAAGSGLALGTVLALWHGTRMHCATLWQASARVLPASLGFSLAYKLDMSRLNELCAVLFAGIACWILLRVVLQKTQPGWLSVLDGMTVQATFAGRNIDAITGAGVGAVAGVCAGLVSASYGIVILPGWDVKKIHQTGVPHATTLVTVVLISLGGLLASIGKARFDWTIALPICSTLLFRLLGRDAIATAQRAASLECTLALLALCFAATLI